MGKLIKEPTAIICLSPYQGGMELDAIKTAEHLSEISSTYLLAKSGSFIAKAAKEKNFKKLKTISFKSSLSLSIIFTVRSFVKKYNIKNIIFFGASELKSLYFAFLGLDINLIVRHGTTKSSPKKDPFHRLIYSNVNYHVGNSKHILNNVKHIIPFGKRTQGLVIYPSFNFQKPRYKKQDKLTLLHVGRIAEGKGQTDAIKACAILEENDIDFQFFIVGGYDENYKEYFEKFFNDIPYKNKISLVGHTNDVISFHNRSDIFLFPSHGEGLSNAFIEALGSELECVCYDNTSFPELKEMGFEFEMVESKNLSKLKIGLLKKAQNFKRHTDNYLKASDLFSLQREQKEYLNILE